MFVNGNKNIGITTTINVVTNTIDTNIEDTNKGRENKRPRRLC